MLKQAKQAVALLLTACVAIPGVFASCGKKGETGEMPPGTVANVPGEPSGVQKEDGKDIPENNLSKPGDAQQNDDVPSDSTQMNQTEVSGQMPKELSIPYKIWYDEPAENNYDSWETRSLPVGNSSIGGNIFGRYDLERITLNEKTFWTGGPAASRPDYNGGNLADKGKMGKTLAKVQELFLSGQAAEGAALCEDLVGTWDGYGGYQLFGNLYMDFGSIGGAEVTNYYRDLDLMNGIASVAYDYSGTHYTREIFASYKDNVMVIRLAADGDNTLDFILSLEPENDNTAPRHTEIEAAGNTISFSGALYDNQLKYSAYVRVLTDENGHSAAKDGEKLEISNAKEVTILLSMGTDYANCYPKYRTGETKEELDARVKASVEAAAAKSYEALRLAHTSDFLGLMARVDLDLGQQESGLATDDLLNAYKKDGLASSEKSYIEVLLYQYGRYLLVSSSRGDTLPANLQGLWVGKNGSAWSSDYHINVNLQMNYWLTYNTNLAECALPLVDFVESLREPGRVTAAVYFGVESTEKNPENGFTANTQITPYGWTCPGWDFNWGWSPAAVPWLLQNVWEYYEYTLDEAFLKEKIYPIMKEEARFYQQILGKDENGKWISTPAFSPEHGPRTNGNAYEQSLIWQLFTDTIIAGEIVGEEESILNEWRDILADLRDPIEIGDSGQVKEWYEETTLGSVAGSDAYGHRHLSHLLGLYPGDLISEETPEWFEAARISLDARVDESTGWAMGQRINAWARLGDGEHMYSLVEMLLKTGILDNLWDTHPPFQIDGNFGYTAGVTEALMQSNMGYINILPALPDAWSCGSVEGIVARGNFELGIQWLDKLPVEISVLSKSGGNCVIQFEVGNQVTILDSDGNEIPYERIQENRFSFETEKGKSYTVQNSYGLEAPKDVAAKRVSDSEVALAWSAVADAAGYVVYRSMNSGSFELLAEGIKECGFIDKTAVRISFGDAYTYQVAAVNADKEEGISSFKAKESVSDAFQDTSHIAVASIAVSAEGGITVLSGVGQNILLEARVMPEEANYRVVNWSVANADGSPTDCAAISDTGVLTAEKEGTGTLKVTATAADGSGVSESILIRLATASDITTSENYLLSQELVLAEGRQYSADYGTKWLTDGSLSAGRYASADGGANDIAFEVEFDRNHTINKLVIYERTDLSYDVSNPGNGNSRFDTVEVHIPDGGGWKIAGTATAEYEVIDNNTVSHTLLYDEISSDAFRFVLRHNHQGSNGITLWEMEAYHEREGASEQDFSALYEAIAQAAFLDESDFSQDAYGGFVSAYQKAVDVANDILSLQKEIDHAAEELQARLEGKNGTPKMVGIYAMIPSGILPVGREMPMAVMAQYDRGADRIISEGIIVETDAAVLQWADGKLKAVSAGETAVQVVYGDYSCELAVVAAEN